ncbi:hypothetical protein ABZS59_30385 [Streptomyces flaveolus]
MTGDDGWIHVPPPGHAWHARSAALLARYRELARDHTLCTKHLL